MSQYNLDDVKLVIRQGYVDNDNIDLATMEEMSQQMSQQLKIDIIEDFIQREYGNIKK